MSREYAFRYSTAEASERDILSVMWQMRYALWDARMAVEKLRPHWTAQEADAYYDAALKLNDGARETAKILDSIEDTLKGVREGTKSVRTAISDLLSECK